jgi:hypothetical protein
VDPVSDALLLRKSCNAGNRTRTSESADSTICVSSCYMYQLCHYLRIFMLYVPTMSLSAHLHVICTNSCHYLRIFMLYVPTDDTICVSSCYMYQLMPLSAYLHVICTNYVTICVSSCYMYQLMPLSSYLHVICTNDATDRSHLYQFYLRLLGGLWLPPLQGTPTHSPPVLQRHYSEDEVTNSFPYIRGGQLFWLGGHFVEAEVGGGPHLLK